MDKYKQAVKLLRELESPKEWKETLERELNFIDKLIECLEEREKVSRATNG